MIFGISSLSIVHGSWVPLTDLYINFPYAQVARAILENPKDKTKVHLIYANVTYEDILLKVCIWP